MLPFRSAQYAVEGCRANLQSAASFPLANVATVKLGQDARKMLGDVGSIQCGGPPNMDAFASSVSHAFSNTLGNETPLELCHCCKHGHEETTRRTRSINVLGYTGELNLAVFPVFQRA